MRFNLLNFAGKLFLMLLKKTHTPPALENLSLRIVWFILHYKYCCIILLLCTIVASYHSIVLMNNHWIIVIVLLWYSSTNFRSSSTRRNLTARKTASRRKTGQDVSLRRHEISTKVPMRRPEAEDSSTMDESSLASIIEDKKSFEKFEREAAVRPLWQILQLTSRFSNDSVREKRSFKWHRISFKDGS